MSVSSDLVRCSGDLKGKLVDFARGPRLARSFRQASEERFADAAAVDEEQFINFLDWFVLQHRLPDGQTVVERFVAARQNLSDEERAMLLGWRDVVEGIFEVQRRDGEALIVVNLVDELPYRVRSNMGPCGLFPDAAPVVPGHAAGPDRRRVAAERRDERVAGREQRRGSSCGGRDRGAAPGVSVPRPEAAGAGLAAAA
jgi:hypothetical protein